MSENYIFSGHARKDSRRVCQLDYSGKVLTIFNSIHEASRVTGICRAGGYEWQYDKDGRKKAADRKEKAVEKWKIIPSRNSDTEPG